MRPRLARNLRRLAKLFLLGLVLGLFGLAGGWFYLRSHLPKYNDDRPLAVLDGPVSVWRTAEAIPVIEAESWADAYRSLGYIHAEDRLFQMELMRRVATGRLAELIGSSAVESDRLMRILGFGQAVERDYADLSPDAKAALTAYAEGVNAWLKHPPSPLPIEFQLLLHRPEPWRPQDCLLWGKLMAWQLSGNLRAEIERAALIETMGARAHDFERMIGDAPITLPDDPKASVPLIAKAGPDVVPKGPDWSALLQAMIGPSGPDRASNIFIVNGAHSATGHPILANDPHLGLAAPILWYPARLLVLGEGRITGVTVPGVPFMILGQTARTAWGMTTTGSDTQDLVVETIDPANPNQILTAHGPEPLQSHTETIKVRFGRDQQVTVRRSHHGPILSDANPAMMRAMGMDRLLALKWSFLSGPDRAADALISMNRAKNWPEFRDAARLLSGPQQNIGYADEDGTIALIAPARLPLRPQGQVGRLPTDGQTAASDWAGLLEPNSAPMLVNPPGGVISNANNPLVGPSHPFLRGDWASGWRARRLIDLLKSYPMLNLEQATALQTDRMAPEAATLLPLLLTARSAPTQSPLRSRALDLLEAWGGVMNRERAEPLIYQAWLWQVQNRLIRGPLGVLGRGRTGPEIDRLIDILQHQPARCDDPSSKAVESCPEILAATLDQALKAITAVQGDEPGLWRWGASHPAMFRHLLFGRVPGLSGLFGRRIETGGGPTALDRGDLGQIRADGAIYENGHAAGYRAIYDLADPDRSHMIVSTGISGNPLSPWYDNMMVLWRNGGYTVLPPGRDMLMRQGIGRLRLLPATKESSTK